MPIDPVDRGAVPNDPTADILYDAFGKLNDSIADLDGRGLGDLADVLIGTPSFGQTLVYDDSVSPPIWSPGNPDLAAALGDLADVDIADSPGPNDGDVLTYDASASPPGWRAETPVAAPAVATAAQYRANTADKVLDTDGVWSAADYVALTDAATVAVDMSTGFNFSLTIGGNRTLGAPSNTKNGQTGCIVITQDGTGSRTLAYHANWKFAGGTDPTLSTAAGAVDVLFYQVVSSTLIVASLSKAFA